jgi:carbonic anhydrase/acetyltransferase-like protein (isoleucine patch superfamily)
MSFKINTEKAQFSESIFIADNSTVIGDVSLGENVSIWYGARLRGDIAPITIGDNSNIQDNATIHVDFDVPVNIGKNVTIGHNAVIHGATIEDDALIGMGAIILNRAVVGKGSIVGAGSVVREGMIIPAGSLVAGVPAKILKELSAEQQEKIKENAAVYIACAKAHKNACQK